MDFEIKARWLFADAEILPKELQFVELKEYGKGQVLVFLGKVGDDTGDYQLFPSKIKNMKELVATLGKDSTKWAGKMFSFTPTTDKKNFILRAI
jgi:hypothetical protein